MKLPLSQGDLGLGELQATANEIGAGGTAEQCDRLAKMLASGDLDLRDPIVEYDRLAHEHRTRLLRKVATLRRRRLVQWIAAAIANDIAHPGSLHL
jgi:hypothetical protein